MLIKAITLEDFGTYAGIQNLNLATTTAQNVVLIGGKNGAGKSTLLEAIRLCFHGPFASRSTNTRDKYERYLLERIHRNISSVVPTRSAAIEIEIDYADQDGVRSYTARRQWERNADGGVSEQFLLSCDGSLLTDVDAAHWQEFVLELIPPGVADLFFFDGERVQILADNESDKKTLSEALRTLLGIDVIEKLDADLSIYKSRSVQRLKAEDDSAARLAEIAKTVDQLLTERQQCEVRLNKLILIAESVKTEVEILEQKFQEQGGAYSRDRGRLEERKAQIAARVANQEALVREHAQGVLPISYAPKLLGALLLQLSAEQDVRVGVVVDETLKRAANAAIRQLRKVEIRRGSSKIKLSELEEFSVIADAIKRTHLPVEISAELLHDLSHESEQHIQSWAHIALESLPKELKRISDELETLYREQQIIERDLSRAPADDVLLPLVRGLQEARSRLAEANLEVTRSRSEMDRANEGAEKGQASYNSAVDSLATSNTQRHSLETAAKIQTVLADFSNVLVARKLKELEAQLTSCFNRLSRKKIDRSVHINPTDYRVTIRDGHAREISKDELSAGEKQVYAISLLWALAKVSGRPLPMIIDTPLARLDKDHRALLGHEYFPNASHQVIVLSTDTEIDTQFIPLLGNSVARAYELEFDTEIHGTRIRNGYFGEVRDYALH